MFHPHTELRFVSESIGYGVFATRDIPAGTVTWALDALDQVFPPSALEAMSPMLRAVMDKYSFTDRRGKLILCWDHARFVNHCCDANCLSPGGFDVEVAVRDIRAGEQLTDDYGTLNIDHAFDCLCGSPRCRGRVRPEDASNLAEQWDRSVREVLPRLATVAQPLWELVGEPEALKALAAGRMPMQSTRVNVAPRLRVSAKAG
ncbi:MAG: SET domain-containing protein [Planctomycetes bacterium]|nr:SET domain-containing protein [Planctomycetota bacterium]